MSARLLVTKSLVSQCGGFRAARSRNRHCNYPWQCQAAVTNAFGQGTRIETGRASNHTAVVDSDPSISNHRTDVSMTEVELPLPDGMVIRGQRWSNFQQQQQQQQQQQSKEGNGLGQHPAKTIKILALHGWLDNCRSFHYLAPKLLEKFQQTSISTETEASFAAAELVAVDLPGHGWSSHRPIDGPTVLLSEGAYYIAEIIDALGWGESDDDSDNDDNTSENDASGDHKVALIGHSMGGSMAVTYAGVFPEAISKVVSIDIYGPEPGTPQTAFKNIRSHVSQRKQWGPKGRPHALYPSLQKAIARRQKAATLAPGGHQYLSLEAATEMVTRSMEPVYDEDEDASNNNSRPVRGYKFKHDARLLWPSLQYLTVEQIQSILERVECPVCLVAAHDGYPFDQDRIDRVVQTLQPQVHEILPGSHHLHADPDTADAVVDLIYDFLGSENSDEASTGGKEGNARSTGSRRDDSQSVDNYGMQ